MRKTEHLADDRAPNFSEINVKFDMLFITQIAILNQL